MNENNFNSNQFVILPKKENGELLQKYEILVYVAIRRFMNKTTMKAYPSLDRISKDTGISKATILKTVKDIVKKGYMTTESKKGFGTTYTFNNEKSFEPFSYEFLDNPNLTKAEKLHILCTQQYMFKENGVGKVTYSDAELSEKTGLNRHTISKTNQSLIEKGFAEQIVLKSKNPETGLMDKETIFHLNELGQAIVFKLKEHEERIDKHDEEIEELKRTVAELKQQLRSQSNIQQYYF